MSVFGSGAAPLAVYSKINSVMGEVLGEITKEIVTGQPNARNIAAEVADMVIAGHHLCGVLGEDLDKHVDAKMAINRTRKWKLNGMGSGQHVENDVKE